MPSLKPARLRRRLLHRKKGAPVRRPSSVPAAAEAGGPELERDCFARSCTEPEALEPGFMEDMPDSSQLSRRTED